MPPDSKDTGEKPWPSVTLYANGRIAGGASVVASALPLGIDPPEERYLPVQVIRERLRVALAERFPAPSGFADPALRPPSDQLWFALDAALDAAFSKEEER
jgi:hypothetical protein